MVFVWLGYLGTQPAAPIASELGLRLAQLYFMFFFVLWLYSDDRPAGVYFQSFAVLLILALVVDSIRYDDGKGLMMAVSFLISLVYMVLFVLGPVLTRWNECALCRREQREHDETFYRHDRDSNQRERVCCGKRLQA